MPSFSPRELERYSRHLALPEVGVDGQARLAAARVLVVGVGGLGTPVASYLAAAGVGTLTLVEHDAIAASNLSRQVLYDEAEIGEAKVWRAVHRLRSQNPHVTIHGHEEALDASNVGRLLSGQDLIVDASDNFPTRYLIHDAARLRGLPSVFGSLYRYEGQVTTFDPAGGPCFRCLFPHPPTQAPSCAAGGVLGVLPGLIGTLQAAEAVKWLLGIGRSLSGRLLLVDVLRMRFETIGLPRDPACVLCGTTPSLTHPGLGRSEPTSYPELALMVHELAGTAWEVLDVREHVATGHELAGARHLPFSRLARELANLPGDRPYLTVCEHGPLALEAARVLRGAGHERAHALDGGVRAYRRFTHLEES